MGSAYQTTSMSTYTTTRPELPPPNSRKRPASIAFPSTNITRKTPRTNLASSLHQNHEETTLGERWLEAFTSFTSLLKDTASYLFMTRPTTPGVSEESSQTSLSVSSPSSSSSSTKSSSTEKFLSQPSSATSLQSLPAPKTIHTPQQAQTLHNTRTFQIPVHNPQKKKPIRIRHIYYERHKEAVKEKKLKELYLLDRLKGYSSDFPTYKSFLLYKQRVAEANNSTFLSKHASSRTLKSTYDNSGLTSEKFQQALFRARDSLAGPGPNKPFTPSLEQLRIADQVKDSEISQRIRYNLPDELPARAKAEVQSILRDPQFVSKVGREQVTHKDIQRLMPGQWLNDEIINFYGQLIVEHSINREAQKENIDITDSGSKPKRENPLRVHFFNTFFWPKLLQGYTKSNLKKWTKKLDLFSKDIILIPINHNQTHWSAAIINFREKRIESYDSMDAENKRKGELFQLLRNYLQDEHREKKGSEFDFTGWKDFGRPDTPQQENGYDCGVFTLNFLECAARGSGFGFKQSNMPYLRQKLIWEIGRAKLEEW